MSTAPSSFPPSSTELENLGVLFVGFVIATVLYGLTFFQTYIYYARYPRDHKWIRYLVAALCILDTAASALVTEVLYYYLIILFDTDLSVLHASTTFCVQYMLSVLITFISHLFFAHRVFQVTGGSRSVTSALVILSLIGLISGLTATVQLFAQRRLSAFGSPRMGITAAISQAAGMVADMTVFTTMCYSLRQARYPELVMPKGFLPNIVTLFVGRGLAFTVVQAAYFFVFVAAPSRSFWIPFQMVASKFYINTLFGHLNVREVKHGRGFNEEDSLTDRKAPTNTRLSHSVRLNVTDPKGVTQSINLPTGHIDIESEGTELESRKAFRDEHGVSSESTQVSSESTQSQPENKTSQESLSRLGN